MMWIGLAAAAVGAALVVAITTARSRTNDLGAVSARWIASHHE
jgi:hypothetical protein